MITICENFLKLSSALGNLILNNNNFLSLIHYSFIPHISKLSIIYEINDSTAKYVNVEKNLIIRRFGLSPSSSMVTKKKYFENSRDKMK